MKKLMILLVSACLLVLIGGFVFGDNPEDICIYDFKTDPPVWKDLNYSDCNENWVEWINDKPHQATSLYFENYSNFDDNDFINSDSPAGCSCTRRQAPAYDWIGLIVCWCNEGYVKTFGTCEVGGLNNENPPHNVHNSVMLSCVKCTDNDGDLYVVEDSGCENMEGILGHNDGDDGNADILGDPLPPPTTTPPIPEEAIPEFNSNRIFIAIVAIVAILAVAFVILKKK